ncbi:MAG: transglutaminase domain-containing protein, partial [Capsulimonadales bacterium]|nr:transglutaminase domain-containing protein [Capsulimonadales bacterium]
WDLAQRGRAGMGSGIEFLMLAGLLNTGFLLIQVNRQWSDRVSLLIGLAVTGFAFSLTQSRISILLEAAFLGVAVFRLFTAYQGRSPSRRTIGGLRPVVVLSGGIITIFLLTALLATPGTASALVGFFIGSGGSKEGDPFGRGGVGDGEGEVGATQKTEDVGFADTDIVIESERRTLFDAVSEILGEPEIPKKKSPHHRKATFLAKEILEKPKNQVAAPRSTRGFSLRRGKAKTATKTANREADALLYVTGRTPCHLRMTAYGQFDGEIWLEERSLGTMEAVTPSNNCWMTVRDQVLPPITGGTEKHAIKFARLATDRIPTLPNTTAVRIDRLDKPDFYRWAQRDILRLDVPRVPSGIKAEMRSLSTDYTKLEQAPIYPKSVNFLPGDLELPGEGAVDERVFQLARSWVMDVPYGWAQVHRVIEQLRGHATCDRKARPPRSSDDPIGWFVLNGRRGPDYLFASSAALMLRSLGYRARLVSGFYVSGERYDGRLCHHPVLGEDIHFWVEVLTEARENGQKVWVPFEPTPGYATISPVPGLPERLLTVFNGGQQWVLRHWVPTIAILAVAVIGYFGRYLLLDAFWTLHWKWWLNRRPERALSEALRLLERRSRWAGVPRAPGTTPGRHFRALVDYENPDEAARLERFLEQVNRVLYAPSVAMPAPSDHPSATPAIVEAARAPEFWTLDRFRRAKERSGRPPVATRVHDARTVRVP